MLLHAPLAIVDVETTGTRPSQDRITEIAVLQIDGFEVTSRWSTLVNPGTAIPAEIQALTGITRDMVAEAPRVVDRWCYLGAARDDGELAELLESRRDPVFDYDHYRIFASHLAKRGVRVVEL